MEHVNMAGMTWDIMRPTKRMDAAPTISIQLNYGRVCMNKTAFRLLGDPDAVLVLYSREYKSVALAKAARDDSRAVAVWARNGRDTGRSVSAHALAHQLRDEGYRGTIALPVQLSADGLVWGDLSDRVQRTAKHRAAPARGKVAAS